MTTEPNARLIKEKGFDSTFRHTEGGEAAALAAAILAGEDEEGFDFGYEMPRESLAREYFDEVLNDAHHKVSKERKESLPGHQESVFFWPSKDEAQYRKTILRNSTYPLKIIAVDSSKIPCDCYEADISYTDTLFDIIYTDPDRVARILNTGPEDKEDEVVLGELDDLAYRYYHTMQKYTGKQREGKEVLCPCDIPVDAILEILNDH